MISSIIIKLNALCPYAVVIVIHIITSIGLFYLINWLGHHSQHKGYQNLSLFAKADEAPAFNLSLRILTPTVFILILSTIWYGIGFSILTKDIYLVVVFQILFRFSYNLIHNRQILLDYKFIVWRALITIGLSILAYRKIVVTRSNILPDFQGIATEVWILIILYFYALMNKVKLPSQNAEKRKRKYFIERINTFRDKYLKILNSITPNDKICALTFAILVIEDFNRPPFRRFIERLAFHIKASKTLGIMQVASKKTITDIESIEIGVNNILEYQKALITDPKQLEIKYNFKPFSYGYPDESEILRRLARIHNQDDEYVDSVEKLYYMIVDKYYKESRDRLDKLD